MSIQNGAELLRRKITDRTKETVGDEGNERERKQMSFLFFFCTDFHPQNQSSDADNNSAYNYYYNQENQQQQQYHQQNLPQNGAGDVDDEEDYSISVSAIMQRRASVRGYRGKRGSRNSRRASSPMDHVLDSVERRRSSVYTTSSGQAHSQF